MKHNKYCKNCALLDHTQNACLRNRSIVDPNKDFCSNFTTEIPICQCCGQPFLSPKTFYFNNPEEEKFTEICFNCTNQSGTCALCVNGESCAFQTDTTCPEPPMIMMTQRNGNMVIQQQVPNPKRIQLLCPSCSCYIKNEDGEEFCAKSCQTCSNYKMKGIN